MHGSLFTSLIRERRPFLAGILYLLLFNTLGIVGIEFLNPSTKVELPASLFKQKCRGHDVRACRLKACVLAPPTEGVFVNKRLDWLEKSSRLLTQHSA